MPASASFLQRRLRKKTEGHHHEGDIMKLLRREFLQLAAGTAALLTLSRAAWAEGYPSRPVRIIVGYPAGNASDIIGRLIAQSLSERLGQPFVVENRPGASGSL